jgi:hypothetical protein
MLYFVKQFSKKKLTHKDANIKHDFPERNELKNTIK